MDYVKIAEIISSFFGNIIFPLVKGFALIAWQLIQLIIIIFLLILIYNLFKVGYEKTKIKADELLRKILRKLTIMMNEEKDKLEKENEENKR